MVANLYYCIVGKHVTSFLKLSEDLDLSVGLCSLSCCLWCRQQHRECMAMPSGSLATTFCGRGGVGAAWARENMAADTSLLGETRPPLETAGTLYLEKCIRSIN